MTAKKQTQATIDTSFSEGSSRIRISFLLLVPANLVSGKF